MKSPSPGGSGSKRLLLYLAISAALLVLFFMTQFRVRPDVRPIGTRADIATIADRDDLNVIFILIDTLRADRLGAYGYERNTSPTLDLLAKTGIRFARHHSQSSWTKTSMASIWTGMYPQRTGILRYDHAIPDSALLPAEALRDEGFFTAGIWRNGWVAPTFGFDQGFEIYHRPAPGAPINIRRREADNPNARLSGSDIEATEGAIEFLRANKSERFFLYVHYMDAHQYLSDEESALFGTAYSDLYDNSIHWTDRNVATLLQALDESGLRDKTIVVIASDHGEAFGEHGAEGHAKDLHRETIEVPWIISLPFSLETEDAVVVDRMSENVDVFPTLLDLLGLAGFAEIDGRSRLPEILAAAGQPGPERPARNDTPLFAHLDRSWGKADRASDPIIAVTTPTHRLMRTLEPKKRALLFDIETDPLEKTNLLAPGAPLRPQSKQAELESLLDGYLEATPPSWRADVERVELDDLQKGQLRAIGYAID